jgi:hypothetical protein
MNATLSLTRETTLTAASSRSEARRYLSTGLALVFLILTLLGFAEFFRHGRDARGQELIPSVKVLLSVHGIAMTLWIVLLLAQSLLILGRNPRLHRTLGACGAVLAGTIVILGLWSAFANVAVEPPTLIHSGGLHNRPFLAVQMNSMLTFGVFVALGLWQRRRPDIHRAMLLLGTLSVMGAPTARLFGAFYRETVWGTLLGGYVTPLLIGVLFVAVSTAVTRTLDRWFAGGFAALVAIWLLVMQLARTAIWERITTYLTT